MSLLSVSVKDVKKLRNCGICGLRSQNGRGFNLCVAPSLKNRVSVISEVCGRGLRRMRMIYAESERGIMIAGGALFDYKLGSCHEASRI